MGFADIVGHEKAIEALRRAAGSGRVAQAYLLVGPPNVGKTMVAKEFAKALNCETLEGVTDLAAIEPCGQCHNCVRIEEENHPDFVLLRPGIKLVTKDELPEDLDGDEEDAFADEPPAQEGPGLFGDDEPAAAQTGPSLFGDDEPAVTAPSKPRAPIRSKKRAARIELYVEMPDALIYTDQIEQVVQSVSVKLTANSRHRVVVIAEVDRIQHQAVDRLLKTLEEPPPRTSFVLTTSNPADVKPTILSRCQILKLQPLTGAQMLQPLAERFPGEDEETLQAVAALSGGRFGRAVSLLKRPDALAVRTGMLTMAAETSDALLMQCMVMGEKLVELSDQWLGATGAIAAGKSDDDGEQTDHLAELREKAIAELVKSSPDRFKRIAMNELLNMLQSWYRDLALLRAKPDSKLVANNDWHDTLQDLAPLYSSNGLRFAAGTIEATRTDLLRHNANMRLACEALVCKLIACRRRR